MNPQGVLEVLYKSEKLYGLNPINFPIFLPCVKEIPQVHFKKHGPKKSTQYQCTCMYMHNGDI